MAEVLPRGLRRGIGPFTLAAFTFASAACEVGQADIDSGAPLDAGPRGDAVVAADGSADGGPGGPVDAGAPVDGGAPPADAQLPLPTPDWDAALEQAGPPAGSAYAETLGSFVLTQPSALATAFQVLASDTGDVRLFANDIQQADGGLSVEYGPVFMEAAGARYQYPDSVGRFRIAPGAEADNTYVSEPFDYRLRAWVPGPIDPNQGYVLELSSRDAVWVAEFTEDFSAILEGTLRGAVPRSEAEEAPFEMDPFGCLAVCEDLGACTGGLSVLADLLDCNGTQLDVDSDGDGSADAYRLVIQFDSESITLL